MRPLLNGRLLAWWDRLRAAYWFIPAAMALGAAVLATVLPLLDQRLGTDWLESATWGHANRPDGARAMLSAIASSMIAVAGVVFSTTIATVTFAAGQLGPRLLANFMRDRRNQFVLGTFTATYLYCLLVMRTVESAEEAKGELVRQAFVPNLAVLVGLGLAVLSIGVLIYFIHHAPRSVHATSIAATLGKSLVRRLQPDAEPSPVPSHAPAPSVPMRHRVLSPETGYVQTMDTGALLETAARHGLVLTLPHPPGAFVTEGTPLLLAHPAERVSDEAEAAMRRAFVFGESRTPAQDALFYADELVEMATRALSPGINDPFTANTCVDWLGSAAVVLARRAEAPPTRTDAEGIVRLVLAPVTFGRYCDRTFGTLRPYAAADRTATLHLVQVFGRLAAALARPGDHDVLRRHLAALVEAAAPTFTLADDRTLLERGRADVLRVLDDPEAVADVLPEAV